MGNECFSKKFIEEDYLYEIRKEKFFSEKETKDEDSYLQTKISYKSNNEKIIFEIKESPFEDYSKTLFNKLNELRNNPLLFYSMAKKYNLNDFFENIISENKVNYFFKWNYHFSKIISEIMESENLIENKFLEIKNYFNKTYNIYIYCSNGKVNLIDDCLFNLLLNYPNDKYQILTENFTYCIIYTENKNQQNFKNNNINENKKKLISYFFFFENL